MDLQRIEISGVRNHPSQNNVGKIEDLALRCSKCPDLDLDLLSLKRVKVGWKIVSKYCYLCGNELDILKEFNPNVSKDVIDLTDIKPIGSSLLANKVFCDNCAGEFDGTWAIAKAIFCGFCGWKLCKGIRERFKLWNEIY